MDGMFSLTVVIFLVTLVIIVIIAQQIQQNAQYRVIQQRLQDIHEAEMRETKARSLRQDRSQIISQLESLETLLQSQSVTALTEEDAMIIDQLRTKVKHINDEITSLRQWIGAPFDFEWTEILERVPKMRSLFLAYNFSDQQSMIAAPSDAQSSAQSH
jgi:predicted membrane protein